MWKKCIRIDIKTAICLNILVILVNVNQSQTAINLMEIDIKSEIQKNSTSHYDSVTIVKTVNETNNCATGMKCSNLPFPCIRCNYNYSCIYGKNVTITCEAIGHIQCQGERSFTRKMNCRYCYQTDSVHHTCEQRGSCNSFEQHYKSNCTASNKILCLGNRTFSKMLKCNWTQGYQWFTTLLISVILGGFGADRFYLGHWQEGIGKLFSFGGLGVWTIVDVLLISIHYLGPADGSLYI